MEKIHYFFFFILFASGTAKAQLKEFEISEMPRPDAPIVQANTEFSEDALIIVYSSLDYLSFRSSVSAVDRQYYNTRANRYEILVKPIKQMIFISATDFMEQKVATLNPKPKEDFYFKVEEKKTALLNQTLPGKLTINSNPAGANISLNGISITNKTPFTGELNPGPTRIQLSKTKYQIFDTLVNVQSSINEVLTINLKLLENLADDFHADGIVKDASGNTFKTVKIGDQVWMAENLKTERYANGNLIPNVRGYSEWSDLNTGAWCNYDNLKQNEAIYGKLYNWYAVADSSNICPIGWHVPTDAEWGILIDYLGGEFGAGGKMKTNDAKYWKSPNESASNESGFSGLPGGIRYGTGDFGSVGLYGHWWSFSESSVTEYGVWCRYLSFSNGDASRMTNGKKNGFYVRCLKD